jgi:ferredoxin
MVTYFHLEFPREIVSEPVVSDAILKTEVSINILRARIDETHGDMIADVTGKRPRIDKFARYLADRGVVVEEIKDSVSVHVDGCTHCGACLSVCPVKAIAIDSEGSVNFNQDKCISCRVCIPVCPVNAISAPPI